MGKRWAELILATAAACVWIGCEEDVKPVPTSRPTSAPTTTTAPSTLPVVEKPSPKTLIEVVLAKDPEFPSTQPLSDAVSLVAAARLVFAEPVHLDQRGDLWITHADAPPAASQLKSAFKQQTHVVPDPVQFVYWRPLSNPQAELISSDATGSELWITPTYRSAFPSNRNRNWAQAQIWNSNVARNIVVPTDDGVAIASLKDGVVEEHHIRLAEPGPGVSTHCTFDTRGVLAWSTAATQPSNVARYVDGEWEMLTPSDGWPDKLLHVVPYQDGSVLAIGQDGKSLTFRSVMVESNAIDEAKVLDLVRQLADPMPEIRAMAQSELSAIGPAAWPILQRVQPTQPAEARIRIRALLGDQTTPTLAGMKPEPGEGRLVCRLQDGGVVLHFTAGISSVGTNNLVQTIAPAWLAVRPTAIARTLPPALTLDQRAETAPIRGWGDEWILEHDTDGPMRWMGNYLEPLTKPGEERFSQFVGIDSAGRWILKSRESRPMTLVIDPNLLDPKPKLPVWTIDVGRGSVGWDKDHWPVMKRGGAWVLRDGAWGTLKDPDVEGNYFTQLPVPTTTSAPTALLVDAEGNTYRNGLTEIEVQLKDGTTKRWPLPAQAVGEGVINGQPVLIEAAGKVFLFNAPGRVIRLTRQFDRDDLFKLDAIFTRNIPATDIRRIWKDPADRIVIASHGSVLSVAFPEGMISNQMSNMIPAKALSDALAEETTTPSKND